MYIREACKLKDVPAMEIKKSTIQNVDFLIRGGGRPYFNFFPNVNAHFKYFS